jgi:hypothetical protein
MKKFLTLLVATLLSVVMYAQIGLGLTEATIKASVKPTETVETKILDGGIKLIRITNDYYRKGYFIKDGACVMYAVLPLTTDACDVFKRVCDSKFEADGTDRWKTVNNGKIVKIGRIFDSEIGEHLYVFVEDDGKDL